MVELCSLSNAPLAGAIDRITSAPDVGTGAKDPVYAARVLTADLASLGDKLNADLAPKAGPAGVVICPEDILERDSPGSATKEQVAAGIGTLASHTVDTLIRQIQVNHQGYMRTRKQGRTIRRPD